jgi:hypothetical protein
MRSFETIARRGHVRWCPTAAMSAVSAATAALLLTACGSSGPATTTVPATAGLTLTRAATVLCDAGLQIASTEPAPSDPTNPQTAGLTSAQVNRLARNARAVATIPAAGAVVLRGSSVTLERGGVSWMGEEVGAGPCGPPVSPAHAGTPAERALVHAVAISKQGSSIADQFPPGPTSVACVIAGGGPVIHANLSGTSTTTGGISVAGTCDTAVFMAPVGQANMVVFSETWSAKDFTGPGSRGPGTLGHSWVFKVAPTGTVLQMHSAGDFPPQAVR